MENDQTMLGRVQRTKFFKCIGYSGLARGILVRKIMRKFQIYHYPILQLRSYVTRPVKVCLIFLIFYFIFSKELMKNTTAWIRKQLIASYNIPTWRTCICQNLYLPKYKYKSIIPNILSLTTNILKLCAFHFFNEAT